MSQFLAYLKCYFQMTFNTVTPALASPPPAYSIGFLHFLKLATSIPIQTSSTNKKSASDIYGSTEYSNTLHMAYLALQILWILLFE